MLEVAKYISNTWGLPECATMDEDAIFVPPSTPTSSHFNTQPSLESKRTSSDYGSHYHSPSIRKNPSSLYIKTSIKPARDSAPSSKPPSKLTTAVHKQNENPFEPMVKPESNKVISLPQLPSTPPGLSPKPATAISNPFIGLNFLDVLTENKRRNRYAPPMVSMSNPLREKVPYMAWAFLPYQERGRAKTDTFSLPSVRFTRRAHHPISRSRSTCDWASKGLEMGKNFWLNVGRSHCNDCKQESLRTKLLVISHYQRQAQDVWLMRSQKDADVDVDMEVNPLESPRLHDLHEFDLFDDDDDDDEPTYEDLEDIMIDIEEPDV